MRHIFVRTPNGIATVVGDLCTGKKDSFGRDVFENDKVEAELLTEYGSFITKTGRILHYPDCGGFHFKAINDKEDELLDMLEADGMRIIKILDDKSSQ